MDHHTISTPNLTWDAHVDAGGTSLRGHFMPAGGWLFEELVARLITASGQDAVAAADGHKTSVEFSGTYCGHVFTLYDYKRDDELNIGGRLGLDVAGLVAELAWVVSIAHPTSYHAPYPAEYGGGAHGYTVDPTTTTGGAS